LLPEVWGSAFIDAEMIRIINTAVIRIIFIVLFMKFAEAIYF
jgi:hypothetical protein